MSNPKEDYAKKLKHPKWQKKRLQILNRDKFTCKMCGDTETTLHVHHKYYVSGNDPWDYPNTALVTLCEHCHKEVEDNKGDYKDFSSIKILKSANWKNGGRIMFLADSESGNTSMRIFDKDNGWVAGYELPAYVQRQIINLLRFALK